MATLAPRVLIKCAQPAHAQCNIRKVTLKSSWILYGKIVLTAIEFPKTLNYVRITVDFQKLLSSEVNSNQDQSLHQSYVLSGLCCFYYVIIYCYEINYYYWIVNNIIITAIIVRLPLIAALLLLLNLYYIFVYTLCIFYVSILSWSIIPRELPLAITNI